MAQKLYTREQMIEAFNYGQNPKGFDWIGDMIDSLTPIELPSDEVIKNEATTQMEEWFGSGCEEEIFGFIKGAKWMRDKLLNK